MRPIHPLGTNVPTLQGEKRSGMSMPELTITIHSGFRMIHGPDAKLRSRGVLPGAFSYDRVAHVLRVLQAGGASAIDLLPLALASSWLVNAKATSRAFVKWQSMDAWRTIFETMHDTLAPEGWLALQPGARAACGEAAAELASAGEGADLTAVSKVLALLRPQLVPLMDAEAIAFAIGDGGFVAMMDWFCSRVVECEAELVPIAARHDLAVLDAAQVLDRLLWFESAGWKHDRRFWWIEGEGIVELSVRRTNDDDARALTIDEIASRTSLDASAIQPLPASSGGKP
jgi:hypothetical protein